MGRNNHQTNLLVFTNEFSSYDYEDEDSRYKTGGSSEDEDIIAVNDNADIDTDKSTENYDIALS